MHYLRTTVSKLFTNREDNESVTCGSKRATLGRRTGKRTYGDVASVEGRSKSICGRARSSAFECDDGAGLACLGLCGCCADGIKGGQNCSGCDGEKLHCGRMYETSGSRFFGPYYLTYVNELGASEDGNREERSLFFIYLWIITSQIQILRKTAHSPTHRKTFSYHDPYGLFTAAV